MRELLELLGPIRQVEVIATGREIRIRNRLRAKFGGNNWRKLKGIALIRDSAGENL